MIGLGKRCDPFCLVQNGKKNDDGGMKRTDHEWASAAVAAWLAYLTEQAMEWLQWLEEDWQ
jgi:hypothetical protein